MERLAPKWHHGKMSLIHEWKRTLGSHSELVIVLVPVVAHINPAVLSAVTINAINGVYGVFG